MVAVVSACLLLLFSAIAVLFLVPGQPATATARTIVIEETRGVEMVNVLVPVQRIEAGLALEPSMFRQESRPKLGLTPNVVRGFGEIKGYFSRALILPDRPLDTDSITQVKPTNPMTANIPEGFRAVTIRTDVTSSVEGWARAGAHVDVIWASVIRGRQAVTAIVQNAKILSAERQMDGNVNGAPVPSTVTLLVTEHDAERIQLAQTSGSLNLSLRGDNDPGKASSAGGVVTIDTLLGVQPERQNDENVAIVRLGGEEFKLVGRKLVPARE